VITLKFGDIITAVASLAIIFILILYPLTLVFAPSLGNYQAFELGSFVSFILTTIIVGYIFAPKIREENRTKTIAKITILFAVFMIFMVYMELAVTEWTPMIKEEYMKANPTATPSASEWYYIQALRLTGEKFLILVLMLVVTFGGLYIGSMLKKPATS